MAHYRKIDCRIWNDRKFNQLSSKAKLVFFFLLTHPNMTSIGAMRANVPSLAADIGWPVKAFDEAFSEGVELGMLEASDEAPLICFRNFIRYNKPESPNVVRSWIRSIDLLPECALLDQILERARATCETYGKSYHTAFCDVFGEAEIAEEPLFNEGKIQTYKEGINPSRKPSAKPSSNPSLNQKQKQKQKQNTNTPQRPPKEKKVEQQQSLDCVEPKESVVKKRKEKGLPLNAPEQFLEFKKTYPKRAGTDSMIKSADEWDRRINEGYTPSFILDRTHAYYAQLEANNRLKSNFVMQSFRFIGPKCYFNNEFPIPEKAKKKTHLHTKSDFKQMDYGNEVTAL